MPKTNLLIAMDTGGKIPVRMVPLILAGDKWISLAFVTFPKEWWDSELIPRFTKIFEYWKNF